MPDLRELYQDTILDHSKRPRNFREIADASATAVGHNPLCGDRVTVYLRLDDGTIADVSFVGQGCAISKASASLMTDAVRASPSRKPMASSSDSTRWSRPVRGTPSTRPSESLPSSPVCANSRSASSARAWPGTPSRRPSNGSRRPSPWSDDRVRGRSPDRLRGGGRSHRDWPGTHPRRDPGLLEIAPRAGLDAAPATPRPGAIACRRSPGVGFVPARSGLRRDGLDGTDPANLHGRGP